MEPNTREAMTPEPEMNIYTCSCKAYKLEIQELKAVVKELVEALEEQEERWGLYGDKSKKALEKGKECLK